MEAEAVVADLAEVSAPARSEAATLVVAAADSIRLVGGPPVEVVPLTSIVEEWVSRGLALVELGLQFSNPICRQGLLQLPGVVAR